MCICSTAERRSFTTALPHTGLPHTGTLAHPLSLSLSVSFSPLSQMQFLDLEARRYVKHVGWDPDKIWGPPIQYTAAAQMVVSPAVPTAGVAPCALRVRVPRSSLPPPSPPTFTLARSYRPSLTYSVRRFLPPPPSPRQPLVSGLFNKRACVSVGGMLLLVCRCYTDYYTTLVYRFHTNFYTTLVYRCHTNFYTTPAYILTYILH